MKKLLLFLITLLFLVSSITAQTKLSAEGNKYLESFLNLRMELTKYHDDKPKAVKELESFNSKLPLEKLSEQEKMILENGIVSEIFGYVYEDKSYDASMKKKLTSLIEKSEKYIKDNPGNINEWLYITTADCFSSYMAYSPVSGAVKYGLKIKKYYEDALALNGENSYCLTHYSQWFYWAPGINGGSKKKTKSHLEKALSCADSKSDKFYAEIYYSQTCYDLGDKTSAATHLQKAKSIYPESKLIVELEEFNRKGYSIFTGNRHSAEATKRVE